MGEMLTQLEPGTYQVDVSLSGGSGRASVSSPCEVHVEDGKAEATIIWSSSNYDYMVVDGEMYMPEYVNDKSVFTIPVLVFDEEMSVVADTTAMSTPHEIEYTLTFDSSTLAHEGAALDEKPAGTAFSGMLIAAVAVALAVIAGAAVLMKKKGKNEEK